jgi:His/Glu/Gln/Arg/opine family amino acid ABC transporter permease subunit
MDYTFNWQIVFTYAPVFIEGTLVGLGLAVVSLALGSIIGFAAASASTVRWRAVRWIVRTYVEIFRNIPLLLWAYVSFYGLGTLGLALGPVQAFVLALSLYGGAYLTEVFRAGLGAIPKRYGEAAAAIGLQRHQRIRLVTLPLMFRIVLPSLSNNFISLFKDTSIAAAISVHELTFAARLVHHNTFRIIEVYTIVSLVYVVVVLLLASGLRRLERRFQQVR